ncbi:helicase MOV-10 [Hyphodiscus hymeniophilus]|uniref:Helicase MOV-10 n=1 Tax=Hyphodiscus hymeniophilus TaxID=353542 RepID=A0A9P6VF66_9HELO|nr:helicase MOV-10 [Hyphodiscus hymeniophilus]
MRQALSLVQEAFRNADGRADHQNDKSGFRYSASPSYSTLPSISKGGQPADGTLQEPRLWLQSMLFPVEEDCQVQAKLNPGQISRSFFDDELNWEQKKAIESVCSHNFGNLPFLISGPPGTGKTKTLVELAVQLLHNVDAVVHVLFCAPSDPAADTVVQRISSHFKPSELLRLNRPARTFAEVPGAVLPFCYTSEKDNKFDLPPFKQLMSYKLVVTTCRDAALLLYSRLTNVDLYIAEHELHTSIHPYATQPTQVDLHWTALLIDESAQAMEPEALIPLCIVAPPMNIKLAFTPLFVMAGDEFQLGPRTSLRSSPLKTSLLARLFARTVYSDHPLARCKTGIAPPPLNSAMLPIKRPAFVNLMRNYRSHPAILAVPSALFYGDTLEPEAKNTGRLAECSEWRGRRWPVLFHNNLSEDDIETDGGGWYNRGEAQVACTYASLLIKAGLVERKEICIMTPFKSQVQCLRKMIREPKYGSLWDIDIGPTEAFQGLERGVVILCTTRSKQRYVESDIRVDWGIIGLPNKMNVALTRAKFGLVVIGNQGVLAQDLNWGAFLGFCIRNGLVANMTDTDGYDSHTGHTRLEKVLMATIRDMKDSPFWGNAGQDDEMWTTGMEGMKIHGDEEDENDDYEDNDQEYEQGHESHESAGNTRSHGTPSYFLDRLGTLERAWNDESP